MGFTDGVIIPFQFGDIKKLVLFDFSSRYTSVKPEDIIRKEFHVSTFRLYNKKIGFEIPEKLFVKYLDQVPDLTNFVIEIVACDDEDSKESKNGVDKISQPSTENTSNCLNSVKPVPNDDLQVVLDTSTGKDLISSYDVHQRFTDGQQTDLAKLITAHEINKVILSDGPLIISNERYIQLANEIANRFPTESATTYYAPVKGLVTIANGKLFDEFNSIRCRYLKKLTTIRHRECENNIQADFPELDELVKIKDNYLLYINAYQKIYELRMVYLDLIENRMMYFTNFLNYSNYNCLDLIDYDFERLHPGKGNKLADNFQEMGRRALSRAFASYRPDIPAILDLYSCGDMSELSIFMMFSYVVENYISEVQPFKKDSLHNLVIHIDKISGNPGETFKQYYSEQSGEKPRVFVTGTNLNDQRCYVFVDNCTFPVKTIQKAVDFCFKFYQTLRLPYIEEQNAVWKRMQTEIYGIPIEE